MSCGKRSYLTGPGNCLLWHRRIPACQARRPLAHARWAHSGRRLGRQQEAVHQASGAGLPAPDVVASSWRGLDVLHSVPLSQYTTFGIGGPADYFVRVTDVEQLALAIRFAAHHGVGFWLLGKGSNTVFQDQGFRGLVILNDICSLGHLQHEPRHHPHGALDAGDSGGGDDSTATLRVGSGYPLTRLSRATCAAGWSGLEFSVGIPGSVGGAVVGNAGAFGQVQAMCEDMAGVVDSVEALHSGSLQALTLTRQQLRFGYRTSALASGGGGAGLAGGSCGKGGGGGYNGAPPLVVTSVTLRLRRDAGAWAAALRNDERRRASQPVACQSAGSYFRNPEASSTPSPANTAIAGRPAPPPPAGWLIERAGLKGLRVGSVAVSRVHANYIINTGGGSAADLRELVARVQAAVQDTHGVALAPEVVWAPAGAAWPTGHRGGAAP